MIQQELQKNKNPGMFAGKNRKRVQAFSALELTECVFCFLLGKIFLFDRISPLGLAYFAALFLRRRRPAMVAALTLGFLSCGMGLRVLQYVGALAVSVTFFVLMREEFDQRPWLYGITAAASTFLMGAVFVIYDGFLLYDAMFLVLESVLCFGAFFVFSKAGAALERITERRVFEPLETLSLMVLAAGLIVSVGSVPGLYGVAQIASLTVIFMSALSCGFPLTCAAGILFGVVNSLSQAIPSEVVAVYAVTALAAGLLQKKGRWGVLLSGMFAAGVSVFYFAEGPQRILAVYHLLSAGILLFLIPDSFLAAFGELVQSPLYAEDSVERLRDIVTHRLSAASDSFEALSEVFNRAVENRINAQMRNPERLFEKTAEGVCKSCSLVKFCWQKEYGDTSQALFTLYGRMERKGTAQREDVPERFRNKCIRLDAFLELLNRNYEVHKVNLLWAGRVLESRNLVAEQFRNVSSVLGHLRTELLTEPAEGMYLERKIMAALDRNGITADAVRVTGCDAMEVLLHLCEDEEPCDGRTVTNVIASALQMPMLKVPQAVGENPYRMRFMEQAHFSMEAGVAQASGGESRVCGDHHLFSVSSDGKFVLALSDGMGQGAEAEAQSNMTVHLLRRLLSAGFDKETALKLMNSMLMVSTEQDSFATADLCLVNLYSGALEFIKIGASQSFLKSGTNVETVECSSLPAGIVCNLDADRDLKYAKEGDFVVLVTDGITDALSGDETASLHQLIGCFDGDSPQALADEILHVALAQSGGKPKDDMTVIAAKLTAA